MERRLLEQLGNEHERFCLISEAGRKAPQKEGNMDKELMMQILIEDRNTKNEALKRIKEETAIIYDDFSEYVENLKGCGVYEGETVEDAKTGNIRDMSYVNYGGADYFIMYIN